MDNAMGAQTPEGIAGANAAWDRDIAQAATAKLSQRVNKLEMDIKFPKKKAKKKEAAKQRILICGTSSWIKRSVIRKTLKDLIPKTLEFVVVGSGRGAEQHAISIAKELGIQVFQAHTLQDKYISYDAVIRTFKPSLIIAFNENSKVNTITEGYQKLARRKDIEFKLVSK